MYRPAVLVLESYMPTELEVGMYFKDTHSFIQYGNETPIYELRELKELPEDMDKFLSENGAPVKLAIGLHLEENPDQEISIVATDDQIGWIEYENILHKIDIRDINYLLMKGRGDIGLYMDDEDDETPHLEDGKVVICSIDSLYEEYEEE